MKITKYRLKKAWKCYTLNRKEGGSFIMSLKLALWWFEPKYHFMAEE